MKRHGVTVAGTSVRRLRVPDVHTLPATPNSKCARMSIGSSIASLTPGEVQLAGEITTKTTGLIRSWEFWAMRVAKAGGAPSALKKASGQAARAAKPRRGTKSRRR